MYRLKRLLLITCTFFATLLIPAPALATNVFSGVCTSSAAQSSAVCQNGQTTTNPLTGSNGLIIKITRVIAFIAGAVAVVIIMLSGLRYINSAGDAAKATQARNGVIYALVGLIVIIVAQYIISLVMSRL